MINHVMLGTNDIDRARRFYDAVLGVLGAPEPVSNLAASGHALDYARVDGVLVDGAFVLMELEAIEPDLFLRRRPESAQELARLVVARAGSRG